MVRTSVHATLSSWRCGAEEGDAYEEWRVSLFMTRSLETQKKKGGLQGERGRDAEPDI